ncbi:MAG: pyridoxamine 5'-phosphate oxidase family protein [Chloroflexi bacterium]|nr:pyridoxamine 5'-phosphate oxidase family protein [Chloroflexota bacterium]
MREANFTEQLLKEVISSQYFAVLNSLGEGLPYSNLVSFAISDDLKSLVFVTNRNTRKYKNIKQNTNVSLLIDNRTNQPSDISQALAITVIGAAHEELNDKSGLHAVFLTRHPQLKQFMEDHKNAIIVINVKEYIIAGFDKTQSLLM